MANSSWLNWRIIVIDCCDLSFYEKGLALYLNTYMNDRQDFAFPSISTICKEMNLARATVVKYLDLLIEKGFLEKKIRFNNSNIYVAKIPQNSLDEVVHFTTSSRDELVHEMNGGSSFHGLEVVHSTDTNKQLNKQLNKQVRDTRVKKRQKVDKFKPPTLAEISAYAHERKAPDLALKFFDYFEAGNWRDAKGNLVKSWKQKFITWQNMRQNNENNGGNFEQGGGFKKQESNHARSMREAFENC